MGRRSLIKKASIVLISFVVILFLGAGCVYDQQIREDREAAEAAMKAAQAAAERLEAAADRTEAAAARAERAAEKCERIFQKGLRK